MRAKTLNEKERECSLVHSSSSASTTTPACNKGTLSGTLVSTVPFRVNAPYDDDQTSAYAEYIELSGQSQYDKRIV